MLKYKVWISQINQQMFEVSANSQEEAEKKAIREWKKENQPFATVSLPTMPKDNMKQVLNRSNWSDATI